MGRGRIGMNAVRKAIQLHLESSLSIRQLSTLTGISRPALAGYLEAFARTGLAWEEFSGLSDPQAMKLLTRPEGRHDERYDAALAFFPYMLKELPKKGVTRQLLWQEYKATHPDGYERSQFCNLFSHWHEGAPELAMAMEHKAGDRLFVDFAGATRTYFDHGVEREAQLFVAILGASQYLYIEAVRSQKKEEFLVANRNALLFFGGVPRAIVCDNLKSAVSDADRSEAAVNPEYEHFARHHDTVIFPARPYSPRDKALVEGAVNIMYTRILAPLRSRRFESLEELNQALRKTLDELNRAKFQRLPFSRLDLFTSVEEPVLKPLPVIRYEYTEFRTLTVGFNYHVEEREYHHFYSVPFAYARKKVSVAIGARTVEVYCDNVRIAFHKRLFVPGYSTLPDHRPEQHRFHLEWTPERLTHWAGSISVNARLLVTHILEKARYPDQAYRSCVGVISLSKKYPLDRLDAACRMALAQHTPNYRSVKALLESGRDLVAAEAPTEQHSLFQPHENLRGQATYQ